MIEIYERAKLSKQFIDFIKHEGVTEELLPFYDPQCNYRCDWNIIGGESSRILFEPYYSNESPLSLAQKKAVTKWLFRISNKIFEPKRMVYSPVSTDLVQLRIATSLIDKLDIPENCKDILFDGMIAAYWIRKHAYDNFYFTEIINLPFLPSARMSKCPF